MSIVSQEKMADFYNNARQIVTDAVERVKMPTPMRLRDLVRLESLFHDQFKCPFSSQCCRHVID